MKLNRLIIWPLLVVILLLCSGCAAPATVAEPAILPFSPGEDLRAVFFDVGQADAILISSGGRHMLVDAGNIGQDDLLIAYLKDYGITRLDYVAATHPHADHIGSMAAVITALDIGEVLMPEAIATTQVFEGLLNAIEDKGLEITVPAPGDSFKLGEALVQVIAPIGGDYKEINDYSLVLRISLDKISYLLTGDAEAVSEEEQLLSGSNLRADVLKVGHHGSASGSSEAYLQAVSPTYAVISCGKDNSYGHPHKEVLARLNEGQTQIYRTDEHGTIEITTDGQGISVTTKKTPPSSTAAATAAEAAEINYIGNRNSKVFHLPSCQSLPAEHNREALNSREYAITAGYRPCGNCKP